MCDFNHYFLTYIFQVAGQMVWYSHFFKNFPQHVVIHIVKGSGVVNKADFFLEVCCFFYEWTDVANLISGSSGFSKSSSNIWKFLVHVLLKPNLENFEHYLPSMWNECNSAVIWTFFGIGMKTDLLQSCGIGMKTDLWDWNENLSFTVLWPLLSFPNLLAYWVWHFHSIIF